MSLLVLIALPLSGCLRGSWEDRTSYSAVWADDDSEVAVLRLDYEKHYLVAQSGGEERNLRYSIRLVDPETGEDRVVVGEHWPESDWTAPDVYFMKSAGYVLVTFLHRSYLHWLDDPRPVPIDTASLTPSANGSLIAVREVPDDGGPDRIGMLHANDQSSAVPPTEVGPRLAYVRWTTDNRLRVRAYDDWGDYEFFEIGLDGEIHEIDEPECWDGPRTSSSELSLDRRYVRVDPETEDLIIEAFPRLAPFGC